MRLARRSLKTLMLRKRVVGKDDEGSTVHSWADAIAIKATVQPAGGSINAAIYGKELSYMKSLMYQGDEITEGRSENGGICLDVVADDDPDYVITSIATYSDHLNVLIKKVNHNGD